LQLASGISQKQLGALLQIDSTTLTRTLAPLRKKGWLRSATGTDRRELRLSLTAAGKREYERALPYWRRAQKGLRKALGKANWNHLIDTAVHTVGAVLNLPDGNL
jgi:DNA-binding MarR family transcriptional regulator